MLKHLEIHNLGIIETQVLELDKGFTVITGETGSGKSMLLGALEMLSGEKVSRDKIRKDTDKAKVQAIFELNSTQLEELPQVFSEDFYQDLFSSDEEDTLDLIISREVKQQGGACRLQTQLVPQSVLKQVSKFLVDIHGQRENQKIFDIKVHERLLDAYGKVELEESQKEYLSAYQALEDILSEKKNLDLDEKQRQERLDLLQYQIEEIEALHLQEGEDEKIKKYIEKMEAKASLYQYFSNSLAYLSELEENNVQFCLDQALQALRPAQSLLPQVEKIQEQLEEASEKIESVRQKLYRALENLSFDENLLNKYNHRLEKLQDIKRKYASDLPELIKSLEEKREELKRLEDLEYILENLEAKEKEAKENLLKAGKKLHQKRQEVANQLEKAIDKELKELYMPFAKFKVELEFLSIDKRKKSGLNKIAFLIEANLGEGFKSLAQTASGGEASRIMLAIKTVLAEKDTPMLLVFDEIDAGVSGEAAAAVGEKLKKISRFAQVICVTHSAYIASMADQHIKIYKEEESQRIHSKLKFLNRSEREEEISNLLSGHSNKEASLALAKALLDKAKASVH